MSVLRLYVIVTRSGEVLVEDGVWSLESAVREVAKVLRRGGVAVVDEFQRMPERWWDLLASAHPSGVLVLSGSSFGVLRRVFDARSPLLGLFDVVKMGLIRYSDALAQSGDFKLAARGQFRFSTAPAMRRGGFFRCISQPWVS